MTSVDALIVGAGPAGLNAGMRLTSVGLPLSVLLIDKVTPWERPIPCAEGLGRLGFEEALEVDPSWIRLVINKATFNSPDGSRVVYTDSVKRGYIIDRAKMQRDLADKLRKRGVEIALGVRAAGVSRVGGDGRRTVTFDKGEPVSARVVIDASGPVSLLGKGEDICWKPYDLEPAYFAVVDNIGCDTDTVHIYAGQSVAPGGYAWVFPRAAGVANIGVVVGRKYVKGSNLRDLLDVFLKKNFPAARVQTYFAGSIPCGYRRGNLALPGLVKCGDAASATNPISRAGIVEALMSGGLAGSAAVDMLSASNVKRVMRICSDYEKAWFEKRGSRHLKLAKVKDSLASVQDRDYDVAAQTLQGLSADKLTLDKIFGTCLWRFPKLVLALRHLL